MKILKLLSLVSLLTVGSMAAQNLHNLSSRNVNQTEQGQTIHYDSQNNIIYGLDRTTVIGGTGSSFPSNIWIEKRDQSGNSLWTINSNITNSQYDSQFIDLALDEQDNIYVAGLYRGPDFSLGGKTITGFSNNGIDFFIAKISPAGNVNWLKGVDPSASHPSRRSLNDISIAPDGNLLVSGQQMRDFTFESTIFKGDSTVPFINNSETPVTFYAKINADGGVLWHHRILNRHSGQFHGRNTLNEMFASENGFIYATFGVDSALIFTNDTVISPQPTSWADRAGILKMDQNGNLLDWTSFVSPNYLLQKLRLDNCGNPVVAGYYKSSMTIGSKQVSANGNFEIFVAKLDSSLNCTWLKSHGSPQGNLGTALAINNRNEVFLAYDFWGELTYDSTSFTPTAVETAIVKLDSSGQYIWHNHTTGGGASIQVREMSVAPNNRVTLIADFNGTKTIDNQTVTNGATIDPLFATFNDNNHPGTPAGCGSGSLSTRNLKPASQLTAYPNPAGNKLNIALPSTYNDIELTLYNMQGEVVLKSTISGADKTLDIGSLPRGIYILKAGNDFKAQKIIKE